MAMLLGDYPARFNDPRHTHRRGQFIFARAGVMQTFTARQSFVLPPNMALWLPCETPHESIMRDRVSLCSLYLDVEASRALPRHSTLMAVSPLLRELIFDAAGFPIEYDIEGREGRVMALLQEEVTAAAKIPFHVPLPADPRLASVCRRIIEAPAEDIALDDWAREIGASRRTFTRLFRRQTGMSFTAWRQSARMMEALSRLSFGEPVTAVAYDVGYASPSAFAALFRRTFGMAPSALSARH